MMATGVRTAVASRDPALRATVRSRRALRYAPGADADLDRPGHVRAGSGLVWAPGPGPRRLVVVQDDACFLALVDPATAEVEPVTLPPGEGGRRQFDEGRGNKRWKLDLEAALVLDDAVVALGSGSTGERERVVVARGLPGAPRVEVLTCRELYAHLREHEGFAGSQLNVEGAAVLGDDVVLLQRGNGVARGGRAPCDALGRLDRAALVAHLAGRGPAPALRDVVRHELGAIEGVRLTFTDAAARGDALCFLAAAEASPDTYADGPVRGVVLGVIDPRGGARWTPLVLTTGEPLVDKAEGLAFDPDDPARAWIVLDRDSAEDPAELCEVRLEGAWPA